MSVTIKANGATKQLAETSEARLATYTSVVNNVTVPANNTVNFRINFTIPDGWCYVGVSQVWSSGAVIPVYVTDDSVGLNATGDISFSAWAKNWGSYAITCDFKCRIICQKVV